MLKKFPSKSESKNFSFKNKITFKKDTNSKFFEYANTSLSMMAVEDNSGDAVQQDWDRLLGIEDKNWTVNFYRSLDEDEKKIVNLALSKEKINCEKSTLKEEDKKIIKLGYHQHAQEIVFPISQLFLEFFH